MAEQVPLSLIAEEAKVSVGTVSRVFNSSSLVRDQTRDRILNVARSMGIRPKSRNIQNRQIALITEPPEKTVMGGYVSSLTQNICFELSRQEAGLSLITEDNLDSLHLSWFDGIIAAAWFPETIERLKRITNIPVVWVNRNDLADEFNIVRTDHFQTGYMAGKYLLDKGHRKLAFPLCADQTADRAALECVDGFRQAIIDAGLAPESCLMTNTEKTPLPLLISRILNENYTAIWTCNEDMASLEMLWLIQKLAGKRIPEDISIMAMEKPGISEFLCPALTTIAQPLTELAKEAVEIVLSGYSSNLVNNVFPVKIIERQSVKSI